MHKHNTGKETIQVYNFLIESVSAVYIAGSIGGIYLEHTMRTIRNDYEQPTDYVI